MTVEVRITGIGLLGPGIADWAGGAARLAEPALWQRTPTAVPAPARLPANERRRAGIIVKAAVAVADQAVAMAGADAAALTTVFASSTGDPANCHALCEALAHPERLLSPTRFTNSVHNAPAGYWHIATHSMRASTSIAAYDASFGAGLLEAAVQCRQLGAGVLYVAADMPYPEPLHALRPLSDTFAVAFVLQPAAGGTAGMRLALEVGGDTAATACAHDGLEAVRRTIPAARALPLLSLLAKGTSGAVVVEAIDGLALRVRVAGGSEGGA